MKKISYKKKFVSLMCCMLATAITLGSGLASVMGEITKVSASDEVNYALGKPYTSSLPDDWYHSYNDPNLTKFTDGAYASDFDSDTVGFYAGETEGPAIFVVDLGEQNYPITKVVVDGFAWQSSGIGTCAVQVDYQTVGSDTWVNAATMPAASPIEDRTMYKMTANVSIDAAKVRFTVSGTHTWTFLDELELWGPEADYLAASPSIDRDLPRDVVVPTGKDVELSVDARSVDSGRLTYQWFKDDAPLDGEVSPSLSIPGATEADTGRYYVKVTNNKGDNHASVKSQACNVTVMDYEGNNLLFGLSYETTLTGNPWHSSYPDTEHKRLTDGEFSEVWGDPQSVGIYSNGVNQYFEMTFDLGFNTQFKQVDLGFLLSPGAGIDMPAELVIQTRKEREDFWCTIYKGVPAGEGSKAKLVLATEGETLTAKEIRFCFEGGNTWMFMDELEVFAERNEEAVNYPLIELPPPDDSNNIAKGRPYKTTYSADAAYPDEGKSSLTDGKKGRLNYLDPSWSGYNSATWNTVQEIVIDLGESQLFQEVSLNTLQFAGYGIEHPDEIHVYTSDDQQDWQLFDAGKPSAELILDLGSKQSFERIKTGFLQAQEKRSSETNIFNYCYQAPKQIKARYVKVSIRHNYWLFIDEIQVFKVAETERASKTYSDAAQQDLPVVDNNNLALGAAYETEWPSNMVRPDDNGKLTDGRRASSSYLAKEWVGYTAADGIGAYLYENTVSATFPTSVSILCSDDKINWRFLKNVNMEDDLAQSSKRLDYALEKAESAQYIKFIYYGLTDGLYMDEIEVLKVNDHKEDADKNPDNGSLVNLIENYEYTISRQGLEGDSETALTDTLRGEGNWVGFPYNANYTPENHVIINFDLTAMSSVSKIVMGMKRDGENATLPKNLTVKVSPNKSIWYTLKDFGAGTPTSDVIWDGTVDAFSSSVENADMAYTRYITIEFDLAKGDTAWLDEIEIIGKRGKTTSSGLPMDANGENYNVALNKSYTVSTVGDDNNIPDTNGVELTDGIRAASDDPMDPAWWGFLAWDTWGGDAGTEYHLKTVVIDLEDVKSVTSVETTCLAGSIPGVSYANQPRAIWTYASMDGKKWFPLSLGYHEGKIAYDKARVSYGWRASADNLMQTEDLTSGAESVAARYIRVDYEPINYCLVDEIEVMGYDGVRDDAVMANGTRVLDNPTSEGGDYLKSGEQTGGIHDMVLLYNSGDYGFDPEVGYRAGDWTPEKLKPHLTYVDSEGKSVDTLFDAVLFLALTSVYGNYFGDFSTTQKPDRGTASLKDWEWYIDKLFKADGDVEHLNQAAQIASLDLNDPDYKIKLVIMIPAISWTKTNFGTLNGKALNMQVEQDWQYLIDWYIDTTYEKFVEGGYEYIELAGYYCLDEGVLSAYHVDDLVKYESAKLHEMDLKYYWIPYFGETTCLWGKDVFGFDAITFQPNHYFGNAYEENDKGFLGNDRVKNAARIASYGQMGIEMEVDGNATNKVGDANKFIDYLNGSIDYGFGGPDVYRNWYVGGYGGLASFAVSDKAEVRNIYDSCYKLMKGTLTEKIPYVVEFHETDPADPIAPNGGGSIGGGSGSGGGGSVTPKPDDKPDPETPPTSDDNYTWEETDGGYKLKDDDGEYVTGWAKVSGKWYYLNADGIRTTGWQKVDNKWYYLKSDGVMATGWLKLGNTWYYLNAGGVMQTGWLYNGGVWYYLYEWGGMANTSWVQVGNTWYYFRGNGAMMTGWLQQGTTWYYLKDSGAMATGWNWVGNKCYYFNASGKMAANTTIGGYKVDASGAWVK